MVLLVVPWETARFGAGILGGVGKWLFQKKHHEIHEFCRAKKQNWNFIRGIFSCSFRVVGRNGIESNRMNPMMWTYRSTWFVRICLRHINPWIVSNSNSAAFFGCHFIVITGYLLLVSLQSSSTFLPGNQLTAAKPRPYLDGVTPWRPRTWSSCWSIRLDSDGANRNLMMNWISVSEKVDDQYIPGSFKKKVALGRYLDLTSNRGGWKGGLQDECHPLQGLSKSPRPTTGTDGPRMWIGRSVSWMLARSAWRWWWGRWFCHVSWGGSLFYYYCRQGEKTDSITFSLVDSFDDRPYRHQLIHHLAKAGDHLGGADNHLEEDSSRHTS